MSLVGIAPAMGVPAASVTRLLAGEATPAVSARLGTMTFSVQSFLDGEVRIGMVQALGMSTAAAQALRNSIGREGAIGVVIGLCLARPATRPRGVTAEAAEAAEAAEDAEDAGDAGA